MCELRDKLEQYGPEWRFLVRIEKAGIYIFIAEYWDNKKKIWKYEYAMTNPMLTAYRRTHDSCVNILTRMAVKIQQDRLQSL
jgi:hypothetical protein